MKLSFFALGWRTLWRDVRSGELRLLILAVTLAVAALTAVGFFADRLQGGLQRDARQLLGGDAVISSDNKPPAAFEERARALGAHEVWLQVNKRNARAIAAYVKAGFHIASEAVADIGHGFVMDDYFMAKAV